MGKFIIFLFSLSFISSTLKAQDVYKTPYGKKFHTVTCRMVQNVSQKITVEQALVMNLDPCKFCHPYTPHTVKTISHSPAGENRTVQCKGYTKSGTRCKHMTSIANGYCYQHNPIKN